MLYSVFLLGSLILVEAPNLKQNKVYNFYFLAFLLRGRYTSRLRVNVRWRRMYFKDLKIWNRQVIPDPFFSGLGSEIWTWTCGEFT